MDKAKKAAGIYTIINKANDMRYIGSSKSNCYKRVINQFAALKEGKHHNSALQQDYDKFGKDMFDVEQVMEFESGLLTSKAIRTHEEETRMKYYDCCYNIYQAVVVEPMTDLTHYRSMRGEGNHKSKLTTADVIMIRKLQGVMTTAQLAKKFGCSTSNISKIHNRIYWRHI